MPVLFLEGTECAAGLDSKLNFWYNERHIPMLVRSKHLNAATRYKLASSTEGEYPAYMEIYKFGDLVNFEAWISSPEMIAAREHRRQTWTNGELEVKWLVAYESLKTWHKGELESEPVILVVGTQCHPDDENKFNNWYEQIHIPMLLKSEHLVGVTRYKIVPGTEGEYPPYLVLYEFKNLNALENWFSCPERMSAREERLRTWAQRHFQVTWTAAYEPLKGWRR